VSTQSVLQAIDTEYGFHAVADPPVEHPARVPVNDRHQVGEAMRQPNVGDIRAPNLIGPDNRNTARFFAALIASRSLCAQPGVQGEGRSGGLARGEDVVEPIKQPRGQVSKLKTFHHARIDNNNAALVEAVG